MTQINLLPWREQKREQDKKWFAMMLVACVVLSGFIIFLINSYASGLVSDQITRNQMLQQEIADLDKQLVEVKNLEKIRGMLIARMTVVHNLQATRTLMVHLFDELIKVTPPGNYLTQLEGKKGVITMSGYAESNTFVSQEMKSIEQDDWLHNPVLNEIKKTEDKNQSADNEFKLSFILGEKDLIGGTNNVGSINPMNSKRPVGGRK